MGHSWCIISVFLLYIAGSFSSSVDTVWGFIGDSVLLSCSIPESELQEDLNVHWRDDEGKNVFDITGNKTIEDQALKYKNRVESFPDKAKGNVSIKLNGLQKTDARTYICTITGPFQKQFKTKIHFKDRPIGRGNHGGLHGDLTLIVSLLIVFPYPFIF